MRTWYDTSMAKDLRDILVIINPNAGRSGAEAHARQLIEALEGYGARVTSAKTHGIADARDIAFREGSNHDLVVACGGDGTLSEVISGLMRLESRPPVGFLPIGSTCDVAKTYKLSSDPKQSARDMLFGSSFAIDIGRVSGSEPIIRDDLPEGTAPDDPSRLPDHFTYIASFGAFTETSYATRRSLKKKLGHFAYLLTGLQSIGEIVPMPVRVLLDGVDYTNRYVFGGIVNSVSVGGMVRLDNVLFDDGYFEGVFVQPPKNIGQFAKLISLVFRWKPIEIVVRERVREAIFQFETPVSLTIDGEYGGTRTEWRIRNIPGAVRLRVPELPQQPTP